MCVYCAEEQAATGGPTKPSSWPLHRRLLTTPLWSGSSTTSRDLQAPKPRSQGLLLRTVYTPPRMHKKILISVLCARDPARCIALCCMQRYGMEQEEQYTMGSRSTGHVALCRSLKWQCRDRSSRVQGRSQSPMSSCQLHKDRGKGYTGSTPCIQRCQVKL